MTNFDANLRNVYDFLDDIEALPRHTVMFYEEPEVARIVAFRFLKNGLERGDICTYDIALDEEDGSGFVNKSKDVHGKGVIECEMQDYGIDTSYYKDKGLLQIYWDLEHKIKDVDSYKKSMTDTYYALLRQFGSESNFPSWRAVGRSQINIKTNDGMVTQLALEKYFQNDPLARRMYNHITTICTYKVDNSIIEVLDRQESWMRELLQNHDAVIYLPRHGNGLALRLR